MIRLCSNCKFKNESQVLSLKIMAEVQVDFKCIQDCRNLEKRRHGFIHNQMHEIEKGIPFLTLLVVLSSFHVGFDI